MKKLWASIRGWVRARLSTPSGRLGATTGTLGGITWYVDQYGDPPVYLTGLLAASVGAFLAAVGAKSQEQTAVTEATAKRAEAKADEANDKADTLGQVATSKHPEVADDITPPLPPTVKDGGDKTK